MTPEQIQCIRGTADIILSGGRVADSFYEALFEIAPETRSLFRDDLAALKLKFMNMLASIVGAVERPEMFTSILTHLGRQHRRFGVKAAYYECPSSDDLRPGVDSRNGGSGSSGLKVRPPLR